MTKEWFSPDQGPMTATECVRRQKEWFQELARAARAADKAHLRERIAAKDHNSIFSFCVSQSRVYKQSMMDLTLFGWSAHLITEADANWVLRYFNRLIGTRIL